MLLNLCSKVAFTGAKQKIQNINRDDTKENQQRRTPNAKMTIRPIKSSLRNGHKTYQCPLKVVPVGANVESRLNDNIINLTDPSMIQLSEAIQAAKLTGKRILVSGKDLNTDEAKHQMPQPQAYAAQSQFEANMSRLLKHRYAQKPNIDVKLHSFTAADQELMCRSRSADDIHHRGARSFDMPESSVMRVRSEHRVISFREIYSDDSDCESLSESEGSMGDMTPFTFLNNMPLECPSSKISTVKYLTVSVKSQEWNFPQTALLCYMINLVHLVFVIACLRGMF
ncbi:uncharacterized protein LOC111077386 [Drosophila obscura]|uniref:uncharacterized protein LOC111077386 n=1 Tax=Drosophila obscura TaxID=7282 RepID=UPI001BB256C4|nr:uncharacterized protein LOC111077386 [Drosophila obscura]